MERLVFSLIYVLAAVAAGWRLDVDCVRHAYAAPRLTTAHSPMGVLNTLAEVREETDVPEMHLAGQGTSSGAQVGARTYAYRMFIRQQPQPGFKGVTAVISSVFVFPDAATAHRYFSRALQQLRTAGTQGDAQLHLMHANKSSVKLKLPGKEVRLFLYWGAGKSNVLQTNARVLFRRGPYLSLVSVQSANVISGYGPDAYHAANLAGLIDDRIMGH